MRDYITVVSGLPRSGTSLMMQMLGAGGMPLLTDGARPPDAANARGYFEYEPVKRTRKDSSWAADAAGRAVKVVYLLLRDLPREYSYRVILMRRDITEVIASQQTLLQQMGQTGAGLPPERLAAIFEDEIRATVEWLSRQPNFRTLEIGYGDCLRAPAAVAGQLNQFAGPLDCSRMIGAVDPNLHRQRA